MCPASCLVDALLRLAIVNTCAKQTNYYYYYDDDYYYYYHYNSCYVILLTYSAVCSLLQAAVQKALVRKKLQENPKTNDDQIAYGFFCGFFIKMLGSNTFMRFPPRGLCFHGFLGISRAHG
jgi:hypothetical protein